MLALYLVLFSTVSGEFALRGEKCVAFVELKLMAALKKVNTVQ